MSAGIQSVISFKKESTFGTAVAPDKSITVRPTGGLDIKKNVQMIAGIKGQLQKNYDAIIGKSAYGGDLTFDAFADYVGYFLLSALGTDTPALHAGETTVYDHVFTENATKPSLTIEQAQSEKVHRFAGSVVNTLKINAKTGEMLEVAATVISKSVATATAITPATTTVPAFNFAQLAIKIGGATIGEVDNIELEYKNGTEMEYCLGSNDPAFVAIKGGSEVSGKISMYLDATTLTRFTNYMAKTTEAIELIATGNAIGSAAAYVLDITIPKAVYTTATTKITDQHNLVEIEFNGLYDTSTGKLIGVTLTNLVAAY